MQGKEEPLQWRYVYRDVTAAAWRTQSTDATEKEFIYDTIRTESRLSWG